MSHLQILTNGTYVDPHFCIREALLSLITLICLNTLISHIAQLFIYEFYCFHPGPHISFKNACHYHLRCPMMGALVALMGVSVKT